MSTVLMSAVYTGVLIAAVVLIGAGALWQLVRRIRRAAPQETRQPSVARGPATPGSQGTQEG